MIFAKIAEDYQGVLFSVENCGVSAIPFPLETPRLGFAPEFLPILREGLGEHGEKKFYCELLFGVGGRDDQSDEFQEFQGLVP